MEQLDPNLNADAYRNLTPANQPVLDKQLEVVLVKDDCLVVAASNMVDRYWRGSIWYYSDLAKFDRNVYDAAIRTESGVRAATHLGKGDKFVVGEDSGLIQVFESAMSLDTEVQSLKCVGYSCQHDDSLTSMSTFSNNTHIVSAGMDSCIKIWDISEMIATKSYNQAQTDIVTSVQTQSGSDFIFVSTSMDSEALLWDTRKIKPALGLLKNSDHGLTTSSWKFNDENILALGAIDGSIKILDIRNVGATPLHESVPFPRGVHKLLFNPDCPNQMAGCCDSTEIKIFDTSDNLCKTIFEKSAHTDFIRGIAWYKNDLISCSYDNTILRHSIAQETSA